jgi:hypothetical protein
MTPADAEFREAVRRLHRAKDAAYRDAWKRRAEVISILANIARKVDRLEYGLDGAPATAGESWFDTAVDLLVYCLKYQAYRADTNPGLAGSLFAGSSARPPYSDGPAGFEALLARADLPSLANGYPNSLVHLYQCLANAARLGLTGVVAEFGMFKGGTTMFLSRLIERLGQSWPVIGFDTFGGFPPRRSALDMYDHPGCVFTDLAAVRRYLDGRDIEIVSGDIAATCRRLEGEDLVLSFIDTDNYTPARAALDVVRERTMPGGAIVFDHFTGTSRFRYTLGERIAGRVLLDDPRWFHLHGTGVFYRQPAEGAGR